MPKRLLSLGTPILMMLILLASHAQASDDLVFEPASGWYLGVTGGFFKPGGSKVTAKGTPTVTDIGISYNVGTVATAIAGYDFGGVRVEGEFFWRRMNIKDVSAMGGCNCPYGFHQRRIG